MSDHTYNESRKSVMMKNARNKPKKKNEKTSENQD